MKFQYPLIEGKILKRYKRFLSDIMLKDGTIVQAHVPNTGSMKNCWEENWKVLVSHNDNPKRKLKYTLECTHNGKTWISVNTSSTNKIAQEAIEKNIIKEISQYKEVQREKKIFDSRLDFFLTQHNTQPDCFVEVKNVTLNQGNIALFPDAVSIRAQKHLKDLVKIKEKGLRSVMLYIINRSDVDTFMPAKDIDPEYAKLLRWAYDKKVEVLAYQTHITLKEISVTHQIKVQL